SPEGDFANKGFGILGQIFATGSPPVPAMPGIASSLDPYTIFLITPGAIQLPPQFVAPLPSAGFDFSVCLPVGFAGTRGIFQTVVLDPATQNGSYASSFGIELQGT